MVNTRSSQCMSNTHADHEALSTNSIIEEESSNNLKPLIEKRNYFEAKVDVRSSDRVIDEIKKKLTRRQTEMFEKTRFGHFLKLERLVCSRKLLHQILLRQLESPNEDASLHFRLGEKHCSFRLRDFALIIGLDCREFDSPDATKAKLSDRFRDEFFPGRERVTVEEVARVFNSYSGNSDADAVKLAQIYLLEGFLMGKFLGTSIDDLFIKLVDDSAEFDRYPWGRVVYEHTVRSMKLAMETQLGNTGDSRSYVLRGFAPVLQFWAFECLPIVGERFGRRIGFDTPRMLNWELVEIPKNDDMESVLNAVEFPVEDGLQPRDEELCKEYFRFFLEKHKPKNGKSENGSEVYKVDGDDDNEGCVNGDDDEEKHDDTARNNANPANSILKSPPKPNNGKSKNGSEVCKVYGDDDNGDRDDGDDEEKHDDTAQSNDNPANLILKSPPRTLKPSLEKRNSVKPTFVMPSSYQVITEIKSKLTDRQTKIFKRTCFGNFLKLQRLRLSRQLIHQILLRQSERPIGKSSMHFRIFGEDHEFSLRDFELITGLDCREYDAPAGTPEVKPSDRFRKKYFRGTQRATIAEIAQAFREYSGKSNGDAVKLALLYLLEAFLLSKPPNIAGDNDFIGFVDDAGEFDRFPWGRYVYEYTVSSMKGAMETRAEKHGSSARYLLSGFPQALQFWAFERFPIVRERFGQRLGSDGPLMLNWGLVKTPGKEDVESVLNGSDIMNLKERERKRKRKRTVVEDDILNITSHEKMHDDDDDDKELRALVRKELKNILRIEISEALSLLKDEVRARLMTEITKQQKHIPQTDIDVASVSAVEDAKRDEHTQQIKGIKGTDNISCFTIDLSEHPNHKLMTGTTNNVVSIGLDEDDDRDDCPLQRHRTQGTNDIPCFTVDLFEHPNDDEKAEFDEWIEVGLKKNKKNKYSDTSNEINPAFNFEIMKCDMKDWFVSLNETAQWLSSSHIDVALHFMRKKKANHPELSKHRCTTTDTLFHARLSSRYSDFKRDPQGFLWDKEPLARNTVRGIEPSHSLPWLGVDFVYVPVNAGEKHWFLAALDLKKRRLDIYDSYHAAKHDGDITLACRPIAEMVPWLLKSVSFFDGKNDVFVLNGATEPWDVELVRAVPQQENGGDCGMFMLKFTEFLMQGESLEKCRTEAISFFRNKMAVELYTYGKKTVTWH